MLIPVHKKVVKGPPPIQVKYVENKKEQDSKYGKIVDAPKQPLKKEKPNREELLAKFDNRSHSNQKKSPKKTYKRKKTIVPQSRSIIGSTGSRKAQTKKAPTKNKLQNKPLQKTRKKSLPELDIGNVKPTTQKQPKTSKSSTKKSSGAGSALAFLDGFNAEQFASLDTNSFEDSDDDEPVSLDTKEEKYASYFARIKHQIERVWIYPSDAARRGIIGDLSLTFRISKDGNLIGVQLIDQSGYEILDIAALKAVKEAAPFYPFPKNIKREKITILANFVYSPPS